MGASKVGQQIVDRIVRSPLVEALRSDSRYEAYPRYAVLVALAAWLIQQLPAGTGAMTACTGSSGLMSLWCSVCGGGAALAAALGVLGATRPGRASPLLGVAALVLCCMPVG
jgi:hypothetical protein